MAKFIHKSNGPIQRIYDHWDAKEELCTTCDAWWLARHTAFRREVRNTYEFEVDV